MSRHTTLSRVVLGALMLSIAAADQVTKSWVVANLQPNTPTTIAPWIDPLLRMLYVTNTGTAFGLFQGQSTVFTIIALLVIAGILFFTYDLSGEHGSAESTSGRLSQALDGAGDAGAFAKSWGGRLARLGVGVLSLIDRVLELAWSYLLGPILGVLWRIVLRPLLRGLLAIMRRVFPGRFASGAVRLTPRQMYVLMHIILGILLGGALGNLVDRFRYTHVVDWLQFNFWPMNGWPIFNIADAAIVLGVVLLGTFMLFEEAITLRPVPLVAAAAPPEPGGDAAATEPAAEAAGDVLPAQLPPADETS